MSYSLLNAKECFLSVSELHCIRVLEAGNSKGPCVVFMHGGPGSGVKLEQIDYIDPEYFRIILIEQRGAGKSTPAGETNENNLNLLIDDVETVRKYFGISQWFITAGSWGTVLSLSYAIQFPDRVLGLIVRGIFLGREEEINWLYADNGAAKFYPDAWHKFSQQGALHNTDQHFSFYSSRLKNDELHIRHLAAYEWINWASISMGELPAFDAIESNEKSSLHAKASIMCHYLSNQCFLPEPDYLLNNINAIQHIPMWIIHGREDVICPPQSAWELAEAHGNAELQLLANVGHTPTDLNTRQALRKVFDSIQTKS